MSVHGSIPELVLSVCPEERMTPMLDEKVRRGLCRAFPKDAGVFAISRAWHESAPSFSIILESGGEIAAHVGMVDRVVRCGKMKLRVAGAQNVFVAPEWRGCGLSQKVLKAAVKEARVRKFDLGLLFCLETLTPIYARCGWAESEARDIWCHDGEGRLVKLPDGNVMMEHALKVRRLPVGALNLCGRDW